MKSASDRFNLYQWILAGWICFIFFSSTGVAADWAHQVYGFVFVSSGLSEEVPMIFAQKSYHVFLFAVLGWLVVARPALRPGPWTRAILWCFVVGSLSEALQLGFPGRGPAFTDILLNGVSGSAAAWIWAHWFSTREQVAPKSAS